MMTSVKKTIIPVVSVLVISLCTVGLVVYMRVSPRFELCSIGIRGNSRLTPQEIVEHLNIQPHTNIFQIHLDEIHTRLNTLSWVKTANIYRNFPDQLSIEITERTPFALIKYDELRIVDSDGVELGALASGSAITLPIITGTFIEQLPLENDPLKLQHALHAIQELMNTSLPVFKDIRKIYIQSLDNATFMSYNEVAPEIRVSLTDYLPNLQRLQRIYPTLQLEQLAYIDLRFERRIIVKSNKS
jgi:cell division septal protein FtsQ